MFKDLKLKSWINNLVQKIGYRMPTDIQANAIPRLLKGDSVMALAHTGSGKTAAYALPILDKLSQDPFGIFALILVPNRELALQIVEKLGIYSQNFNLRTALLIGGTNYLKNIAELEAVPHIVVGTPGRAAEMLQLNQKFQTYIAKCRVLVLDQADRLLEDTLLPFIKTIRSKLVKLQQVILASATIDSQFSSERIRDQLSLSFQVHKISTIGSIRTVATLTQLYVLVPEAVKDYFFFDLIRKRTELSMIVFINTCRDCQLYYLALKHLGYPVACLHSFMKQVKRQANLAKFNARTASILITTDVSARGLDIPEVKLVINHSVPKKASDYVHRVGRTARASAEGTSITLVTQRQTQLLLNIEEFTGVKLRQEEMSEEQALLNCKQVVKSLKQAKVFMLQKGLTARFNELQRKKKQFKRRIRD